MHCRGVQSKVLKQEVFSYQTVRRRNAIEKCADLRGRSSKRGSKSSLLV